MPRLLVSLLAALAVAPATAGAAVVEISVLAPDGVAFGESQGVVGRLTGPFGAPLVGSKVVLQARRYPFGAPFAELATATT
ncbi:MAG: hypothetical protein M3O90_04210, partial [Actinomycetota bacterium]|nr:hypothetical protein [Actinomycetota bacterium]